MVNKKGVIKFIENKLSKTKIFFYGKNYKIKNLNSKHFEFQFNKNKKIINQPSLNGVHQIENASIALAFAEVMQKEFKFNFNKL